MGLKGEGGSSAHMVLAGQRGRHDELRVVKRRKMGTATREAARRKAAAAEAGSQVGPSADRPCTPRRMSSTTWVKGERQARGLIQFGISASGMKTPLRKSRGNRKKFRRVMASKTSLTMTEAMMPASEKIPAPRRSPRAKISGRAKGMWRRTTSPRVSARAVAMP